MLLNSNFKMKTILSIIGIFFTVVYGYSQKVDTIYTDSTYILMELNEAGIRDGKFVMYESDYEENILEKGTYKKGAKSGKWEYLSEVSWLDNNVIDQELFDADGQGILMNYDKGIANGKVEISLGNPYSGDHEFIVFNILGEGQYLNGKKDGAWSLYHLDSDKKRGKLAAKCTFNKGKKVEPWLVFMEFGKGLRAIPEIHFMDSVEIHEQYPDESYASGFYNNGLRHGNWTYYSKYDEPSMEVEYDLGIELSRSVNTDSLVSVKVNELRMVYQHPDLIKPNTINFSDNNKFVVVSKDDRIYKTIAFAVYGTKNHMLINSDKIEMPLEDFGIEGITNDGRYLQIFNYKKQKAEAIYDVLMGSILYEHEDMRLFDFDNIISLGEFNSGDFYIRDYEKALEVENKETGDSYLLDSIYNQKPHAWEKIHISPDEKHIGVMDKKVISIWDTETNQLLWESPKQQTFFYEPDFRLLENNIVLCNRVKVDQKDMQIYWYDYKNDKILYSSNSQAFASLSNVGQIGNIAYFGLGDPKKLKTEKVSILNLATGMTSTPSSTEFENDQFYKFQKFVRDSFELAQPEYSAYVNTTAQSYYKWTMMHDDYFDDDGIPHDESDTCQLSYDFFMENDFDEYLKENFNVDALKQYQIVYALNNRATYFDKSDDFSFGLMSHIDVKKGLLFWNGNMSKGERKVKMLYSIKGRPFFYSNDLYYFGSQGLNDVIRFTMNGKLFSYEQFDLKYNRPDIILDRLGYADSTLVKAYHKAYQKRLKKMGFTEDMLKDDFHLPEIKIENFEYMPSITDSTSLGLNLHLNDSKYKLDRINVWLNDVAVYGSDGISLRDRDIETYKSTIKVNLVKGHNKIQVSVLNQAGAESYKETVEIESTGGKSKPDLYLITIGESEFKDSSYNLTYAAKDAKDVGNLFSKSTVYHQVFTKTLTNEQVTKSNVADLKGFIAQAGINDEVMLFIAGHGVLDKDLDYFFATYDMDFNNPTEKGLTYEDLEGLLDGIKPIKKTMFVDACHSGEIDKEEVQLLAQNTTKTEGVQFRAVGNAVTQKLGVQNTSELTKSLFTDLRKGTGATVISSAGGMEFAMEGDDWNNGLFTYCLINGIKSKEADLNKDGEIWLSELKLYVSEQVAILSNGKQQPTSRIENQVLDYRVW